MAAATEVPVGTVECLGDERYRVQGRTGSYVVEPDADEPTGWSCRCPDWQYRCRGRLLLCRHQRAAVQFREAEEACSVCGGRAWFIPNGSVRYVDRQSKLAMAPIACVECLGTGKRNNPDAR